MPSDWSRQLYIRANKQKKSQKYKNTAQYHLNLPLFILQHYSMSMLLDLFNGLEIT